MGILKACGRVVALGTSDIPSPSRPQASIEAKMHPRDNTVHLVLTTDIRSDTMAFKGGEPVSHDVVVRPKNRENSRSRT